MGNTSYYQIPYPEQHDIPDGAGQMRAIADAVEKILHDGYKIPSGDLTIGETGSATGRVLRLPYLYSAVQYEVDVQPVQFLSKAGAGMLLYTAGVFKACMYITDDAQLQVREGSTTTVRPIPFAAYTTERTVVVSAAGQGTLAFTFPTGRFTQPPIGAATVVSTANYYAFINGIPSITGMTVGVKHYDNTVGTANIGVHAMAFQMTATSGQG
jgi:hypothetical protein